MNALVETGYTSHPLLIALIDAQRLNHFSGGAVVAPWDLEPDHEMEEWIEAADALSEIPSLRARKKAQQKVFTDARRTNPYYSTLHRRH